MKRKWHIAIQFHCAAVIDYYSTAAFLSPAQVLNFLVQPSSKGGEAALHTYRIFPGPPGRFADSMDS